MNTQLKIEGMSCNHCVRSVKEALQSVPGVVSAEVDLANGSANVTHSPETGIESMIDAVTEEGYQARVA